MDTTTPQPPSSSTPRRRRMLATGLAIAGIAVAVPAAGALASGDEPAGTSDAPATGQTAPVQQERQAPSDRDCPERDGSVGAAEGSEGTAL